MNDYISREAAIKVLCDACGNAACPKGLIPRCSYYEKMQSIPAADVQPVKFGKLTGEWLEDEYGYCRCSICGYELDDLETTTPYCPNCGAKMESEDK